MKILPDWAIIEKNKLSQSSVWIHLVEMVFPASWGDYGLETIIRLTSDIDDTVWSGYTWRKMPMVIGDISENLDEIPQCSIQIGNELNFLDNYILALTYYNKTTGMSSVAVNIYVVNSDNLSGSDVSTHVFELQSASSDNRWITLNLSAPNPFRQRFPTMRLLKNICQYKYFKGKDCGYSGDETSCDRTLYRCRELSNSSRFGGFPGVGDNVYRG